MGTRIEKLRLLKVIDGGSVRVELDGKSVPLRLIGVDTEESNRGEKPVTHAGHAAAEMARNFFSEFHPKPSLVDVEFDTDDPIAECLEKYRGTHGRLICYVHFNGVNYNLEAVRGGWSPYFSKYGFSRLYHDEFVAAEAEAMGHRRVIWNPQTNAAGPSRDYQMLLPWWNFRGALVEAFRRRGGGLSARHDYTALVELAAAGKTITIFCDLRRGVTQRSRNGSVIYIGTRHHPFNLYLPDTRSVEGQRLVALIALRYADYGRGYVYLTGTGSMHEGVPQILVRSVDQLSDSPPRD